MNPRPRSAGLLMYRFVGSEIEVLLAHPGGPFYRRRDEGVWTIPKGLIDEGEIPIEAARREFFEETGFESPPVPLVGEPDPFLDLGTIRYKNGKTVACWAFEGDADVTQLRSNTFEVEWPPRTGRIESYPEVDRAEWSRPHRAFDKVNPAQRPFLGRLLEALVDRGRLRHDESVMDANADELGGAPS